MRLLLEARQKRSTFDNEHLYVDLAFCHRLLKCHVTVDLKIGAFSHADAGQMNVYLNYYREQEMSAGDNPPVGIILCAQKNDALVRYATTGLSEQLFVRKYQIGLPSETELNPFLRQEQQRWQSLVIEVKLALIRLSALPPLLNGRACCRILSLYWVESLPLGDPHFRRLGRRKAVATGDGAGG